ncbi:MAG: putative glycoside hydrolase [Candidatus Peribacteraceae bacterium]|nr:putative glycoside hydrolase [Candidatus Peribacteraceae bacterium]
MENGPCCPLGLRDISNTTRVEIFCALLPAPPHSFSSGRWMFGLTLCGAVLLGAGSAIPIFAARSGAETSALSPQMVARQDIIPLSTEERRLIRDREITTEVPHFVAPEVPPAPSVEEVESPVMPETMPAEDGLPPPAAPVPAEPPPVVPMEIVVPAPSIPPPPAEPLPVPDVIPLPEQVSPPEIPVPVPPEPAEPPAPLPEPPSLTSAAVPPAQIGVYLTEGSVKNRKFLLETLDRMQTMTGAAIIFNVKGGYVHFDSDSPLAEELNLLRPSYNIAEIIALARERGIYTIGRFIAVKDPNLARAVPDAQIRHPKTERSVGNVWVDASHPMVLAYNAEVLEDLVQAGIDEVNLDYIRYPTEYAMAGIGLTGQEKADRLEQFIRMARSVIDRNGGKTKLGISTYAILGWNFPVNFESVGQDIARFAPMVDVISPMAYPATFAAGAYYNPAKHPRSRMYYLVYRTLTGYAELLGDQAWKIRPWIQGYGITRKNLQDEIDAVFDSGACGFTIWSAGNTYGLFYELAPSVRQPEECRKGV